MLTNFNNSFTIAFSDELQKKQKKLVKIYHLTWNLLPHYLVKTMFKCATLQQFNVI